MSLIGKRVAVLAEEEYEDMELWYPLLRLRGEGANVVVVGTGSAENYNSKHGYPVKVDIAAEKLNAKDVDAVVIPGGYAPDRMRRYPTILKLVREVSEQSKIVAFICHAGWVPISAGIVKGRKVTSVSAIKDDLVNAGATWVDEEVVRDGNLISSRRPADLPAFADAIVAALNGSEADSLDKITHKTSALEALRMAIRAEESGARFYSMAKEKTKDPEAKHVFNDLAKEEERHRAILQDEYNRLTMNPEWDRYSIWREVM
jgi:protease I